MILLDANALIALFADEPAAAEVEQLLVGPAAMTATNAAEAIDFLLRNRLEASAVRARWTSLLRAGLRVVAVDERLAWAAATLRARRYHRRSCPLALADCVLLAAAGPDDAVASSDRPVVATARAEGIAVRALLDSRGVRPE